MESELVLPVRIRECSVHMEARVRAMHEIGGKRVQQLGGAAAAEVEILRVHVDGELVLKDHHVDSTKWSPLIYSFRHYYRLAENELGKTFGARV